MPQMSKAAAILLLLAACSGPPYWREVEFPPLEGIQAGDTAEHVREVLGKPNDWENGWWREGGVRFEPSYQVWFYAGKGRVIFEGFSGRVFQSQADPRQPKHAIQPPYDSLYQVD